MELKGISPQIRGEKFSIGGRLSIGKQKADIVLGDDDLVSFQHALIVAKENQFYVADTHSLSGTYLNDRRLEPNKRYPIKPGDKLSVGTYQFVLEEPQAAGDLVPTAPVSIAQKTKQFLADVNASKSAAASTVAITPPPVPVWLEAVRWHHRLFAGLTDAIIVGWLASWIASTTMGTVLLFSCLWVAIRSVFHLALDQSPGEILFRLELRNATKQGTASVGGIFSYNVLSLLMNVVGFGNFWSSFFKNRSFAERSASVSLANRQEMPLSAFSYRAVVVGLLAVMPLYNNVHHFTQDPRVMMIPEPLPIGAQKWGTMNLPLFDLEVPWRANQDLLVQLEYRKGPPIRYWHEVSFQMPVVPGQDPALITVFGRRPSTTNLQALQAYGMAKSIFIADHWRQLQLLREKRKELTREDGVIDRLMAGTNNHQLSVVWKQWVLSGNKILIELSFTQGDRQIVAHLRGHADQSEHLQNIASDWAQNTVWRPMDDQARVISTMMAGFKGDQQSNLALGQSLLAAKFSIDPKDIRAYYTLASIQSQLIAGAKDNPRRRAIVANNMAVLYRTMLDVDPTSPLTKSIERVVAQLN